MATTAQAQATKSIDVLISVDTAANTDFLEGFRAYLLEEGVKVNLSVHSLKNSQKNIASVIEKLHQTKPDLLVTLGSKALDQIGGQFNEVPVIASMVVSKTAIAKHKNVTGVALEFPLEEQVEWIHKILPRTRRVGVIYNSKENHTKMVNGTGFFEKNGINLTAKKIDAPTELMTALNRLSGEVDTLLGINDEMVINSKTAQNLLLFSLRNKIPFIGLSRAWVKAGAIYALERDYHDVGRQCAEMAVQSLKGKNIDKIRAEGPRKTRYSINLKIAKRMKIKLSDDVISEAEVLY